MAKIYEKAPESVLSVVSRLLETTHSRLGAVEAAVAVTMVSKMNSQDELVPCLKHRGVPCVASVRLTRPNQRVYIGHDAEIVIDAASWEGLTDGQKTAIIDHELNHVEICKDKQGRPKVTDDGRPKLRLKPDDFTLTGFYAVVIRHGASAAEWNSVRSVHSNCAQALIDWETRQTQVSAQPLLQVHFLQPSA